MYKDRMKIILRIKDVKLRFFDLEILLEWYIIYNDGLLFWYLNIIFFYKYL